jgi:hypothetical protein
LALLEVVEVIIIDTQSRVVVVGGGCIEEEWKGEILSGSSLLSAIYICIDVGLMVGTQKERTNYHHYVKSYHISILFITVIYCV